MKQAKEIQAQNARIGQRIVGVGKISGVLRHVGYTEIYVEPQKESEAKAKVYKAKYGQKISIEI